MDSYNFCSSLAIMFTFIYLGAYAKLSQLSAPTKTVLEHLSLAKGGYNDAEAELGHKQVSWLIYA